MCLHDFLRDDVISLQMKKLNITTVFLHIVFQHTSEETGLLQKQQT